jgi:hypothetical protein
MPPTIVPLLAQQSNATMGCFRFPIPFTVELLIIFMTSADHHQFSLFIIIFTIKKIPATIFVGSKTSQRVITTKRVVVPRMVIVHA